MKNKVFSDKFSLIYVSLIGVTPAIWLVLSLVISLSRSQLVLVTILNIPSLFLVGFMWGKYSQEKRIMALSEELDNSD